MTVNFECCASRQTDGKSAKVDGFPINMNKVAAGRSDMRTTRWGRHIPMGFCRQERRLVARIAANGTAPKTTHDQIQQLQQERDRAKDQLKTQIRESLGNRTPAWLRKAGLKSLRNLKQQFPETAGFIESWEKIDSEHGDRITFLSNRVTARLEEQYTAAAHAICQYLEGRPIPVGLCQFTRRPGNR